MTKKQTKTKPEEERTLFARIPAEQHRRLKLLAIDREVPVVELVREALDKYLGKDGRNG
jgi:hypothetical protein